MTIYNKYLVDKDPLSKSIPRPTAYGPVIRGSVDDVCGGRWSASRIWTAFENNCLGFRLVLRKSP